MALKDFLNAIAPKYSSDLHIGSVDILEHDAGAFLKKVVWKDADFQHLDHQLAKDMKCFFDLAGSPDVFMKDCDGIVMFETEGKKYMFLTELKSNFGTEHLMKAKIQIISSFLKANMLFHLSNCYKLEDYIIKGFIVSYPPKKDFKVDLFKGSMLSDKRKEREFDFAKRLVLGNGPHITILRPTDLYCLKGLPLGERGIFPKIEIHYIEVAPSESEIELSVKNFI